MSAPIIFIARLALLSILAVASVAQEPQTEAERVRGVWNGVFEKVEEVNPPLQANAFLQRVSAELEPGRALDAGMGRGPNAIWLAEQGWKVTGVDISDKAVAMVKESARARGVEIDSAVANLDEYDYGREKWDLVVSTYMHSILLRSAEKVIASLKPGGLLVVEGFHRDINRDSVQGGRFGFDTNELPRVFDSLRILHYEDLSTNADWGPRGEEMRVVRFLARKPVAVP